MSDKNDVIKELQAKVEAANKHVTDIVLRDKPPEGELDISESFECSRLLLDRYVTLDWEHCLGIMRVREELESYYRDSTRRRPLNIIMRAFPGSGKSHFAECLAASIDGMDAVASNMAATERIDDLAAALESVRNLKVLDKWPLLFLDEFDSHADNYARLLPLLWDGQLTFGTHDLRIGKVAIILASSKSVITDAMKLAEDVTKRIPDQDTEKLPNKLPDLVSRINGPILSIPALDDSEGGKGREVDKVCIAVSLLSHRFESLEIAPWALLSFIAKTEFRNGVRSIAHVIDTIDDIGEEEKELRLKAINWPLDVPSRLEDSYMARHLIDSDGRASICNRWAKLQKVNCRVRVASTPKRGDFELFARVLRRF
ncbi:MAG: P-loop NTPase family protein [Planctomycetota bacterium]|jgi:hypothetical protein